MSSEFTDQQQSLREELDAARQDLSALEATLAGIDSELAALAEERHRYELLERICGSLEELEQLGGGALFWGETRDPASRAGPLRMARERVAGFESRLASVEERRRDVLGRLQGHTDRVDLLDYDLAELREQEENRKAEWIIEREESALPHRAKVMPWTRGTEEDSRFRRTLAASMAASLLVAALLPLVDLPIPELAELAAVPERVARLVERDREIPPPAPAIEEPPEPEPLEPEREPEPVVAEERPEPEAQPVAEAPEPSAAEKVKSTGILAFRESFAARAESRPSAQLGAEASLGNTGEASVGRPQRAMVTSNAPGSSGGINLASISRNFGSGGGPALAGVEVAQVASSIGTGGAADRPLSAGHAAGRTDEEIQIVFDRYKSALYRLYNRELRRDPTLRGQIVVRLTIEPDGSVSMCRVETSDMGAPDLAQQVIERIRGFDFGAKDDVVAMTIIYPIDFLPAA